MTDVRIRKGRIMKGKLKDALQVISERFQQKRSVLDWFLLSFVVLSAINLTVFIVRGGEGLSSLLWNGPDEVAYTDFFESINDAMKGNPYADGVLYPPFCYLFLWIFSRFLPGLSLNWPSALGIRGRIVVAYLFFALITATILYLACRKIAANRRQGCLFSLMFLLSPGYIYMIGQGNIVILAVLMMEVYYLFYDSTVPWKREAALIALAVAANVKFYPAVLGFILLRDKKFHEAFRCALYGFLLFFLSFLPMGGISQVVTLYNNIRFHSHALGVSRHISGYGYGINLLNLTDAVSEYFHIPFNVYFNQVAQVLLFLLVLAVACYAKEQWKRLYALTMILTLLVGFSWMYNATYLLIPLVAFFYENREPTRKNLWYAALFFLMFAAFPYGYVMTGLSGYNQISVSTLLVTLSQCVLLLSLAVETLMALAFNQAAVPQNHQFSLSQLSGLAILKTAKLYFGKLKAALAPPAALKKNSDARKWLRILLLTGSAYYMCFIRSVIPLQTGWWQYMGWRILQGDLPYRDFYLFLPPYYVLFTSVCYVFFGKHLFLYSILGFLLTRVYVWFALYRILIRKIRPSYAALAVMTGLCLTSSYLMCQTFDYNPVVNAIVVTIALFLMKFYEAQEPSKERVCAGLSGLFCGILLMTKHTIGIVIPIFALVTLIMTSRQKKVRGVRENLLSYLTCMAAATLPGVLYLASNGIMSDFLDCLASSSQSKIGNNSVLLLFLNNAVSRKELILFAFLLAWRAVFKKIRSTKVKRIAAILTGIVGLTCVTVFYRQAWETILAFLRQYLDIAFLNLVWLGSVIVCFAVDYRSFSRQGKASRPARVCVTLLVLAYAVAIIFLPKGVMLFSDYRVLFQSAKHTLLYLMFYFDAFLWWKMFSSTFIRKEKGNIALLIPFSIGMLLVTVQFLSSELEELHAFILVGILVAFLMSNALGGRARSYFKKASVVIVCMFLCLFCLLQKILVPYEWHGWRTSSLYDASNPMSAVEVEGLEGFRLPQSDAETYVEMAQLVKKYSEPEDIVYQFPNISLFHVLAERKSIYAAIPYFDVVPDTIAVMSARTLQNNPPKMVIWANMSEARWEIHERFFRGGQLSGQRELQRWHDEYVTSHYRRADVFNSNMNTQESISFFVKSAFAGGIAEERIVVSPQRHTVTQYGCFFEDSFQKYVFMIPEDVSVAQGQRVRVELRNSQGVLLQSSEGELIRENREYWSLPLSDKVFVDTKEVYSIRVDFLNIEESFEIGVTALGSATAERYCEYGEEGPMSYNLSVFCE